MLTGCGRTRLTASNRGFHQQAILCGYLGDDLIAAPIEALYDWVAANPAPADTGEAFDCSILTIERHRQGRDRHRSGKRATKAA